MCSTDVVDLIPYWQPLECELSVDLIHAVLKEKKIMDKMSLLNYLRFCCRISLREVFDEIIYKCQPTAVRKAVAEFAKVEQGVFTYLEDSQRPLTVSASPVEDISSILKSMMDWYGADRADGIVRMCEINFKIEIAQETLNELFGYNFTSRAHALQYAYLNKLLLNKDGEAPFSAKEAYEDLFAEIKDEIRSLVKTAKMLSEGLLREGIFNKFGGLLLDHLLVAIIYEVNELDLDPEAMYKTAFEEFAAVVCDVEYGFVFFCKEDAAKKISSIFNEVYTSLPLPDKPIFLHDGCAAHPPLGMYLPFAWLNFAPRTLAEAAERIREMDLSAVKLVILNVGEYALRENEKATAKSVFAEVIQLIKAIREKTSEICKIQLWTLPIHHQKDDRKAVELNMMYENMSGVVCYDINRSLNSASSPQYWRNDRIFPFDPEMRKEVLIEIICHYFCDNME